MFKVGDKVRQIGSGAPCDEGDAVAIVTSIPDEGMVWHKHIKSGETGHDSPKAFQLVQSIEPIDKYTELKQRIEALSNGWDKEADDILQEIQGKYYICVGYHSWIGIRDSLCDPLKDFSYNDQCSKMDAFKSALLWLLDHSNIKKDEKQEKITALETQLRDIQTEIDKLK